MSLTLATIALLVITGGQADDGCVGWDDLVEDLLFDPVKDLLVQASSEFVAIPNLDEHFGFGSRIRISGGEIGNLTTFDVVHLKGRSSASYMCQNDDNITVAMDLTVNHLEFRADNFMAKIPALPKIGNTKAIFKNTGNKFSISVTVLSDDQSNCTVHLNYLQIQDYGKTTFHFQNGVINKIYQWIMSHGYSPLTKALKMFHLTKSMEKSIQEVASNLITQQGQQVCNILTGGL